MERTVVATIDGGPPEFVTPEAGVLVDPGDPEALVARPARGRGARGTPHAAARTAAAEHDVRLQTARMADGARGGARGADARAQTSFGTFPLSCSITRMQRCPAIGRLAEHVRAAAGDDRDPVLGAELDGGLGAAARAHAAVQPDARDAGLVRVGDDLLGDLRRRHDDDPVERPRDGLRRVA